MNSPRTAAWGNRLGATCVLAGVILTVISHELLSDGLLWLAVGTGTLIGWGLAMKVAMIHMPQLVGTLNGLGGGASALVALLILGQTDDPGPSSRTACAAALAVGGLTFSGSLIAAGKLARWLPQLPMMLPGHAWWSGLTVVGMLLGGILIAVPAPAIGAVAFMQTVLALAFGAILAIRVGGADMPITISLLNSLSGIAGAFAGFAVRDPLLVAAGGIVGAAGLILTVLMCRASNRTLMQIVTGRSVMIPESNAEPPSHADARDATSDSSAELPPPSDPLGYAADCLAKATQVVVVPGYGMALAEAQQEVRHLYDKLEAMGKNVRFAIHPVAGRMPGHMHVLLSEVEIPYEHLYDLPQINDDFAEVDVVLVIGANDVVNPAANTAVNTPIYGMPILKIEMARQVIIFNQDTRPGYSGVPNPLYQRDGVVLCLGDARETVHALSARLES